MNASLRLAAAVAIGTLFAPWVSAAPVPSTKANYEPPTMTFQAVSGQKILLDLAGYCANVFSKETNDELTAKVKKMAEEKILGGLDLTRPSGGYIYLRPKIEDSAGVFVMPITGEKEALDTLAKLGIEVVKEDKARGLYTLRELKFGKWDAFYFLDGVAPVLRFHDKHAYIALHNGTSDVLNNPDKLVPITALVNDKDTAHIAGTLHLDRYPQELQKPLFDLLLEGQQAVAKLQQQAPPDMPKSFPACAQQALMWCQRNLTSSFAEGDKLKATFTLDAKAGDHDLEMILTPKAKSPLAADILAVKKANGRFAQLLNNEAVTGISLTLPGPIPADIRTTAGAFLGEGSGMLFDMMGGLGGAGTPLADVVNKQLTAGQADIAGAVYGPNKDGVYTALAAVGIADAAGTEKALKAAMKDAPKEIADLIKWDAVKIGDTKAHTVAVVDKLPETLKKAFGEKNLMHVVFTKDAAYVAVGPDAVSRIEKAMALKAADCVGFNMVIHREKFSPLVTALNGRGFPLSLAEKNETIPVYRLDVFGGDGLHVKFHMGAALFMFGRGSKPGQ
jgi:hypothetical protein